jgi:hypothetical protein
MTDYRMSLFGRNITVKIESVEKEIVLFKSENGFSIEFYLEFGNRSTCLIRLINISEKTIDLCKRKETSNYIQYPNIEIFGGYNTNIGQFYSGEIVNFEIIQRTVDTILEIKSIPFYSILVDTYISETYENYPASAILKKLLTVSKIYKYKINLTEDKIFPMIALNGSLQTILTELALRTDSQFYDRNGVLVFESKNFKTKRDSAPIILSPESGLVGIPQRLENDKLHLKSFFNYTISKGNIFKLQVNDNAYNFNDYYQVKDGRHFGGNKIKDYYTEFECERI